MPGPPVVYHGGSNGSGHRCLCAFEQHSRSSFIVMTNGRGGTGLRRNLADAVYPQAQLGEALGGY